MSDQITTSGTTAAKYHHKACVLLLGSSLLLQLTEVTAAPISELEDRLTSLEKQSKEQTLLLLQYGQDIQRLNTELGLTKQEIQIYKQRTEDQALTILLHEEKITDQAIRLQQHEEKVTDQAARLQQNEEKITDQAARLQQHEETIADQALRLQQHEENLFQYKKLLTVQNKRIDVLEQALDVDNLTVDNTLTENAAEDNGVPTNPQKRLVLNSIEGPVAFYVTANGDLQNIKENQVIILDTVELNLGNSYHSQHGLFIAPVAGVYSFSTSVMSSRDAQHLEIQVAIKKNGVDLGMALAHSDGGRHDQGATTVVTQLNQGDEVWIAEYWPDNASYYGGGFTSFSGCLIYEI